MEKINIAELLKDCPQGMELDCTMFEKSVKYAGLTKSGTYIITIKTASGGIHYLTKEGYMYNIADSKCIIFPKGKTTWEGFVPPCKFKDGDIIATNTGAICIFKKEGKIGGTVNYYCGICEDGDFSIKENAIGHFGEIIDYRFATKEEKAKLFKAIKEHGYKWNEETKTLDKLIEPKFKIGDRIVHKVNKESPFIITEITNDCYKGGTQYEVLIEQQNNFELVPYKFDINTLKPFESRVLVRNSENQYWNPAFWGFKAKDGYVTTFGLCNYCVPYEGNEHLLETTDDCSEIYKTWE